MGVAIHLLGVAADEAIEGAANPVRVLISREARFKSGHLSRPSL
jgi:hypothetical protein